MFAFKLPENPFTMFALGDPLVFGFHANPHLPRFCESDILTPSLIDDFLTSVDLRWNQTCLKEIQGRMSNPVLNHKTYFYAGRNLQFCSHVYEVLGVLFVGKCKKGQQVTLIVGYSPINFCAIYYLWPNLLQNMAWPTKRSIKCKYVWFTAFACVFGNESSNKMALWPFVFYAVAISGTAIAIAR